LIDESLRGKHRVAAASLILDRLEGRSALQLNLNNITDQFADRTDEELQYRLERGCWPEDDQPLESANAAINQEK
jgi:hypothetical protein